MKKVVVLCAACGIGKSTMKDFIEKNNLLPEWICLDTDDVGLNWWDYAGTDHENKYQSDSFAKAVELSGDKDLFFVTCMNPLNYYRDVEAVSAVTSTYFIGLVCSDEQVTARLKARPAERQCGSDEFIKTQIDYNNWFKRNAGKFQLFIDNTNQTYEETAKLICDFVKKVCG